MIYKMTLRNSYDLVREAKDDAIRAGAPSVAAYIKVTYKPEGNGSSKRNGRKEICNMGS